MNRVPLFDAQVREAFWRLAGQFSLLLSFLFIVVELPPEWNRLVSEEDVSDAKLLHYTIGIPAFPGYEKQDGAEEWWREFQMATEPVRSYGA